MKTAFAFAALAAACVSATQIQVTTYNTDSDCNTGDSNVLTADPYANNGCFALGGAGFEGVLTSPADDGSSWFINAFNDQACNGPPDSTQYALNRCYPGEAGKTGLIGSIQFTSGVAGALNGGNSVNKM